MAKKRTLTKEKIIAATRILAAEIGIQQVNFQRLAEELGIKYPSLYNHFENMGAIRRALSATLLQELNELLQENLGDKKGREAITLYADTYVGFAFKNQAVYELLINIPQTQAPELLDAMHETNVIFLTLLDCYQLSETDKLHKSRAFRSLLHGFLSLRFLGYFQRESQITAADSFQRMVAEFCDSLEKGKDK